MASNIERVTRIYPDGRQVVYLSIKNLNELHGGPMMTHADYQALVEALKDMQDETIVITELSKFERGVTKTMKEVFNLIEALGLKLMPPEKKYQDHGKRAQRSKTPGD